MLFPLARKALAFNLQHGISTMLVGSPGIGKTDMVGAACADVGRPCVTDTLSTMESVDLRGLPIVHGDSVIWAKPDFIDRLYAAGPRPVWFVDEANTLNQSLQVPLMQATLANRIGPHALPDGTTVVMAGNKQSDRAAAQRMGTALCDRLDFIDVEPCLKAWLEWAAGADIHPMIRAFLMLRGEGTMGRPGMLHNFDPSKPEMRSFCSPRSWAISTHYPDAPDDIRHALLAGKVGEAAAAEFEGFRRVYMTLPPIPVILADPAGAPLPTDPSTQYAVAVALSRAAKPGNFANVLQYMARVGREFEIVTATDAIRRNRPLADTSAYIDWASRNSDVSM